MSATTPDGLVSFKGYLASGGGAKNTGQPPYTIKAADLDNNFQRVVVKCKTTSRGEIVGVNDSPIEITRASDGQKVQTAQPIRVIHDLTGQIIQSNIYTVDTVIDGVIRQMIVVGQLVPEA
jgi:hypothetical protein